MVSNDDRRWTLANLRAHAEQLAAMPDMPDRRHWANQAALDTLHEIHVREIELELQNEALRQAHAELELQSRRYKALFDLAPVGYCTLDQAGVVIDGNLRAAALLGAPVEMLRAAPFSQFVHADDQDQLYLQRRAVLADGTAHRFELRVRGDAAMPVWLGVQLSAAPDAAGTPAVLVAFVDISERKRVEHDLTAGSEELERRVAARTADLARSEAGLHLEVALHAASEERLLRSEGLLRTILDAAADAIVTTDQAGNIALFNRAAERMFGWTSAEVLGKRVDMLLPPQPFDAPPIAPDTGWPLPVGARAERVGVRKEGTQFPLELSLSEVADTPEHSVTALIRDLTERNQREAEFRQAQKLEAVARLASGIAHDFNNLLMGVIGCADAAIPLLPVDHAALERMHAIKGAAERGTALTRQLLSYVRPHSEDATPLRMDDVVPSVVRIVKSMLGEDIRLSVKLNAPGGVVLGDANSIEQVLMNLAVNARDAMQAGGKLAISTRELELPADAHVSAGQVHAGRYVELAVEDTGGGIAPATQEHLFEPFFTTKALGQGTGLGLYTVYGIVTRLGGAIDLRSAPGEGTRFAILLPLHTASPPVPQRVARVPSDIGATLVVQARQTILVVEDESLIRMAIQHMLRPLPYDLLLAEDFDDAVRVAATHAGPIDVLLTDIVLPGGAGGALAETLRASRPGLRVLFMSAYPTAELLAQGRIPPDARSLEKPFDQRQLRLELELSARSLPPQAPA